MSSAVDGLRLAVGTLSVVRTRPPAVVDARTARWAAVLAPVAVLPLGVAAGLVALVGDGLALPSLAVAVLVVATLALGTRAFHLDGLSDVADGLTASYDSERSLAVMKSGTSGPAGTVALLVVLGLQVAALAALLTPTWSAAVLDEAGNDLLPGNDPLLAPIAVAVLVCLSRWSLLLTCVAGPPAARSDGLGTPFAGCVPRTWTALGALVLVLLAGACAVLTDAGFVHGLAAAVVALVVVGALLARCVRRFGGTTGDVHGAAIEVMLAVLLLGLVPTTVYFAG
ncbi:adenosylcobinamide-GDP ribazoletransferase [Marmoricola endophyticus]|uniref:Adenosylcobinamide-GDP ribazoletransferase n=1 Tax=Marmoricola endophyticus TaxID=2040280 RepID=A0A917B9H0_9ACTN|nr:adenosylcobinamide-GDP ribazoletransferase [Marmoricola endophyticus]GGF31936.1 adenosylcobinamide-GDP ribazoletransferase [Marmoricola endophyticus]